MMDAIVKASVEEAVRFLRPGDTYRCCVNTHDLIVVAIGEGGPGGRATSGYLVACETCKALLEAMSPHRRIFVQIHKHTNHKPEGNPTDAST